MTDARIGGTVRAFGILGGTFDPIHHGHIALARTALAELDLEHVLFVPNADPPHKQVAAVTPSRQREAMVILALEAEPSLVLSRVELERAGPSYAVDTVAELAAQAQAEGRPEPWFVMSAEALEGFGSWREPERILELCRIAVSPRPGSDSLDGRWVAEHFPGRESRFTFLPGPRLDIASTAIRERLARGESIAELVPAPVARYIEEAGLYAAGAGA